MKTAYKSNRFSFPAGLACALTIPTGQVAAHTQTTPDLVGEQRLYHARTGDTAYRVARNCGVGALELMKANGLRSQSLKRGTVLVVPSRHIPPLTPPEGIVLNIPERAIYVFRNGRFIKRFPCAVGKPTSQTVTGNYTLRSRVTNPTWRPPRSMVVNEGVKDEPVPPGPGNPLGDRWMGWSKSGFGFHSTLSPRSIGRAASHGCVRLYPEGAREMFKIVRVGMPIYALYKPALIGKAAGAYYLSVFPDIYGRGGSGLRDVQKILGEAGLLPLVDKSRLHRVISNQASTPQRILGEEERIEINGSQVSMPVQPMLRGGNWLVPLTPLAGPLGLTLEEMDGESFRLVCGNRTFEGRIGDPAGMLDGATVSLAAAPVVLDGNLILPLRLILDLTGAQSDVKRGEAIRLTTSSETGTP